MPIGSASLTVKAQYYQANLILALLLDYLAETRGWKQGVARSVATTHLIDRVAAWHGMPVYETKVGFKNLADYIVKDLVTMIGEEADGFSMRGHLPEKDGILACILVTEMVARKKKDLPQLVAELFAKVGAVYSRRLNLSLSPGGQSRIAGQIAESPRDPGWTAGRPGCHPGWPQVYLKRRQLALPAPFRHRTGGPALSRSVHSPAGLHKLQEATDSFIKGK